MKLHVKTEDLQKKLPFINHAISSRSQMPILLNLLLEAKEGKLHISATDLEIGIYTTIEATIEEEGVTTVPAKPFSELIGTLTAATLTFEIHETSFLIKTTKTKNALPTIDPSEFPTLSQEKEIHVATLLKDTFQKQLAKVIFAASIDTGRPALSGIYMKKEEDGFLLVATDGYRLSLKHYPTGQKNKDIEEKPLLIPSRIFKEVAAIREESNDISMYMSSHRNQVLFSQGETTLIGRLIDAEFPPYERIIPLEKASTVSFDRDELLKAVKICAIFAREGANIIKFTLQKESIIVSANASSGDNMVSVDASLIGEENEIAFNAKYLLDVLSTVEENDMVFEMTGPLNPGVFKIKDDGSFLHLIMPIRVQA
jgi:DNA polymerase-3 subunit beta